LEEFWVITPSLSSLLLPPHHSSLICSATAIS
jgi:hypothetical protein